MRIPEKGRGRALKRTWLSSKARVLAYMDVDLSTDPSLVPCLVDPILAGQADVAFGSRLLPASLIERSLKREIISRTYNFLLSAYLHVGFHDTQCGFKAISANAARQLLPLVENNEWFFDTELLVRAERAEMTLYSFPVRWREDPGTTVHIVDTVIKAFAIYTVSTAKQP